MFIKNRKTGAVFPATEILLALAEDSKHLEVIEHFEPKRKKQAQTAEPAPTVDAPEPEVGKVSINTATAEALASLAHGIGFNTAEAIVEHVATHGPFQSIDELIEVSGVGQATIERNRDILTV